MGRYILEDDTDDVPLIEYDFGKDGKHFLVASNAKETLYIRTLKKRFGNDFDYIVPLLDDDDDEYEYGYEADDEDD